MSNAVKQMVVKGKNVSYRYLSPGRFLFDVQGKQVQSFPSPSGDGSLIVSHGLFFGVTIRETETHDLEIKR